MAFQISEANTLSQNIYFLKPYIEHIRLHALPERVFHSKINSYYYILSALTISLGDQKLRLLSVLRWSKKMGVTVLYIQTRFRSILYTSIAYKLFKSIWPSQIWNVNFSQNWSNFLMHFFLDILKKHHTKWNSPHCTYINRIRKRLPCHLG